MDLGDIYVNNKTENLYIVCGGAVHSETEELLILYSRLTGNDKRVWARNIELFKEKFTRHVSLEA